MSVAESDPGPQLTTLEDAPPRDEAKPAAQTPASGPDPAARRSRRRVRVFILLLLAAVVVLALLLAGESRYSGQLEARIGQLSAEVAETREALGAYQRRMRSVRRNVDELASRVGALQELVKEDAPPSAKPAQAKP
jgi:outer membrane murein-binding lipoprotein Lpp